MSKLRSNLVSNALEWQDEFGVAPPITSTLSEYDAAILIGMTEQEYSEFMQHQTAVQKGYDFIFNNIRYQVKGNRPSGKPGSKVTKVPKATNYEWDVLIWVLYNKEYEIQEAWLWPVNEYEESFQDITRLSPKHLRQGQDLLNKSSKRDAVDGAPS